MGSLRLPVLACHAVLVAVLSHHGRNGLGPLKAALQVRPKVEEFNKVE